MIENGNYKWAQSYAFNYWSAYDDESLLMLVNVLEFDSELDQLIRTDKLDEYKLKKFKRELAFFTDEYSGYMSDYILDLKSREKEITRKCEEYFESVEKAKQAEEEKRLKKLKASPPYEGLSEDDIDNTSWGKHIYAKKVSLYTYSNELKKHGVSFSDSNGKIYTFSGTHYRYALCGDGRVLIASRVLKKLDLTNIMPTTFRPMTMNITFRIIVTPMIFITTITTIFGITTMRRIITMNIRSDNVIFLYNL